MPVWQKPSLIVCLLLIDKIKNTMRTTYKKSSKFTPPVPELLVTAEKLGEWQKKLEHLKNSRPAAMAEVSRLADLGDFSENAGYQFAKGRLRGINRHLAELESQIDRAVIIETQPLSGMAQVGSLVTVEINGKQKTYQILGSTETDPSSGVISNSSPLGAVLLGSAVGEEVVVKLDGDREAKYKIIKID